MSCSTAMSPTSAATGPGERRGLALAACAFHLRADGLRAPALLRRAIERERFGEPAPGIAVDQRPLVCRRLGASARRRRPPRPRRYRRAAPCCTGSPPTYRRPATPATTNRRRPSRRRRRRREGRPHMTARVHPGRAGRECTWRNGTLPGNHAAIGHCGGDRGGGSCRRGVDLARLTPAACRGRPDRADLDRHAARRPPAHLRLCAVCARRRSTRSRPAAPCSSAPIRTRRRRCPRTRPSSPASCPSRPAYATTSASP